MRVSVEHERKMKLRRWSILLISPLIWTLSFSIIYLLDEAVCNLHFWRWAVWGEITAVIPVMLLILVLTLSVTLSNIWFGWKMWHQARAANDETVAEQDKFLGAAGVMMGVLFTMLTAAIAVVLIRLQPC